MYYLAPPRDAYGSPQPGPWFFGNVACGPDRRPGSEQSCSGSYDVRLFAKYGSATGRVEYATNQPVADGWVVASELFNPDERYVVRTDGAGNYTFTKTDTAQLPVLPPDQAHPSTPSPASNNWGLPVFGDGGRPGTGIYVFSGGPVVCPENPQSRMVIVRSSQATEVDLRSSGADCDGCPLPAIPGFTDPVAQWFEDEATAGRDPVDRQHLTADMYAALQCFEAAVVAAGGAPSITSAYRPTEYQRHLYMVWRLSRAIPWLSREDRQRCRQLIADVQREMARHGLAPGRPVAAAHSAHEDGEAFDADPALPAGVDLVALAAACGLSQPVANDPVHFERTGRSR